MLKKKMAKLKKTLSKIKSSVKKAMARKAKAVVSVVKKLKKPAAIGAVAFLAVQTYPSMVVLGEKAMSLVSQHPSSYTVKITNMAGNSGGTGVVVKTSKSESEILTNAHVCGVVNKKPGKITTVSGRQHMITSVTKSPEHDLCIVTVAADLKHSVSVASQKPSNYSEATITGHPALMPNIITKGHFGDHTIITIMIGVKKCTDADMRDPKNGMFCAFFGSMPILKEYESQVVSATIMGGSSGSAVLDSNGNLAGLVFAGNQGLSYAYIVPYEAVVNFLSRDFAAERAANGRSTPWEGSDSEESQDEESIEESHTIELFSKKCSIPNKPSKIEEFCTKLLKY